MTRTTARIRTTGKRHDAGGVSRRTDHVAGREPARQIPDARDVPRELVEQLARALAKVLVASVRRGGERA